MAFGFGQPADARNACRVERRDIHDGTGFDLVGRSASRSRLVRVMWALVAIATGIGALVTFGVGVFAPPEIEQMAIYENEPYFVDWMRVLFFATIALGAVSCFSLWKASHRGGLGFWRSTSRPALLSASAALMAAGLNFSTFFAVDHMQFVGLAVSTLGAAGFLFFWILRGPPFALRSEDAYWGSALRVLFGVVTAASSIACARAFQMWSNQDYKLHLGGERFVTQQVYQEHWNSRKGEWVSKRTSYEVPRPIYNPLPVASALFALLAVGGFSETLYRRRLMKLARQGAFEKLF
jgi:hypothetical protein